MTQDDLELLEALPGLRRDAARYRWLTKNAYVGVCYTDQAESGQILEIGGCDRRVPDEVGEFCDVGKAIDAAMAAEGALGVGVAGHQTFSHQTPTGGQP